jgi:hypothetical protein
MQKVNEFCIGPVQAFKDKTRVKMCDGAETFKVATEMEFGWKESAWEAMEQTYNMRQSGSDAAQVRRWTGWAHTGGGNALAFKQPT